MSRIHLKRLEIRELFGRSFDLKLDDLGEGVTVVYGPNASGKSSLASAAGRVFCTKLTQTHEHVRAKVTSDDITLDVELRSARSDNPVPQSSRPWLYVLSIPDLIAGPSAEDTQLISDTLAGGLDLARCLPYKGSRTPDLDSPRSEMDRRRTEAAKIAKDEDSLGRLELDREEADRAEKDLSVVENWIKAAKAEIEAGAIEGHAALIGEANPGIELQQPNAAVDVQEALKQLNEARVTAAVAHVALEPYEGRIPAGPLIADHRAELDRIANDSIKRAAEQESVGRSIDRIKSEMELLEQSLPELGSAPLPIEPECVQLLAEAVSSIGSAKDALSRAESAARESDEARRRALESLESFGYDAESVARLVFNTRQLELAIELDDLIRSAREAKYKAESALSEAKSRLYQAKKDLPRIEEGVTPSALMELIREDPPISDLADRSRKARVESEARQAICRSLEQRLEELKGVSADAERGSRALVDWMKAVPATAEPKRPFGAAVAASAIAVLALILVVLGLPTLGAIVGVAGLIVVAGRVWFAPAISPGENRQRDYEGQVPERWRPAQWTIAEVAGKLEDAVTAAKVAQAAQRLLDDAKAAAGTVDPTTLEADLNSRLDRIRALTGLDFTYPYELALLVSRLARLQDSAEEFSAKDVVLKSAIANLETQESSLRALLQACGANVRTGAQFKELAAACVRFWEAQKKSKEKESERSAAVGKLEFAKNTHRELLDRFKWPSVGDAETSQKLFLEWIANSESLMKLGDKFKEQTQEAERLAEEKGSCSLRAGEMFGLYGHPAPLHPIVGIPVFLKWFEVSDAARQADRTVVTQTDSLNAKLRRNGVPDEGDLDWQCDIPLIREADCLRYRELCAEVREKRSEARLLRRREDEAVINRYPASQTAGFAELSNLSRHLAKSAEKADSLSEQISRIRAEINLATQETGLVTAQKNLDSAIAKSLDWLALMAQNAANRAVLSAIERATREENTTPVILNANRWLERLTEGKYGALTEENKVVCVQDRDHGNLVQQTGELSTGTRVHLALSIRLAVIEQSETDGKCFPLFLDEVMATSDPGARTAMAYALKEISQERQVIVLTNQPDDVNLLKKVLGEDMPVKLLPKAEPVPIAPPAQAPEGERRAQEPGLPLGSSVRRWRAHLIANLLESPVESDNVRVDTVIGDTGNENDLRIIGALESVRKSILAAYKQLDWRDLSAVDLGGQEMRDRVREAYDRNRTNPEAFLIAVDQIKGRRTNMVERLRIRLEELEILNSRRGPTDDELLDLATSDLPQSLRHRAGDIVDVFRDYLTTPEGLFS